MQHRCALGGRAALVDAVRGIGWPAVDARIPAVEGGNPQLSQGLSASLINLAGPSGPAFFFRHRHTPVTGRYQVLAI